MDTVVAASKRERADEAEMVNPLEGEVVGAKRKVQHAEENGAIGAKPTDTNARPSPTPIRLYGTNIAPSYQQELTTTKVTSSASPTAGKEGVCLIEVVSVQWVWACPWQRCSQERSTGSGFVIHHHLKEGKYQILTNAHVVSNAIDIRVRLHGKSKRFRAQTSVYAPDVDLALLELQQDDYNAFFGENNPSLALRFADALPALQERVHVVGFPTGGRTICFNEGVVSRIDNLQLASAGDTILSIQIDAAINAGNSGGPVFDSRGFVTGVAYCKASQPNADNIGYLIPAEVVRAFLGRCHKDGSYSFSPVVPYWFHALENKSLRLYHNVPDNVHGVLLTRVYAGVKDALLEGDVLTKIDGFDIADDGQVRIRGDELIQHCYLLRGKRIDEETTFTVFRKGNLLESKPCVLKFIPEICARWPDVDHLPNYLVIGALVLLPLSQSLMTKKEAGTRLYAEYYTWLQKYPEEWGDVEELVVLSNICVHEVSFSYSRPWRRVLKYNGTPVKSLRHLSQMWEASCKSTEAAASETKSFARIELLHDDDIVLEVNAAMQAQAEILETHQIPKASQSKPPNPKYRLERNTQQP